MPSPKKLSGSRAKNASPPTLSEAREGVRLLTIESRLRRYLDLHLATLQADIKALDTNLTKRIQSLAQNCPDHDIQAHFPDVPVCTVFDVGANIGQSAKRFRESFPIAKIHCFEPVPATFQRLVATLGDFPACECHNLALGSCPGQAFMRLHPIKSTRARVVSVDASPSVEDCIQPVAITTLDIFCEKAGIDSIDLLKIDTEGFDLEVLRGAEHLISKRRIKFIIVEAGMNPDNTLHVPFHALHGHLGAQGYLLFHIYEQSPASIIGQPHLRRADLLYISPELLIKSESLAP